MSDKRYGPTFSGYRHGAIVPLEDCIAKQQIDMGQFRPAAVQQVRLDGKVYGIPEFFQSRILLIDTNALDEAGVARQDLTTTDWAKLAAANDKLTKRSGGKLSRIGFDPKLPGPGDGVHAAGVPRGRRVPEGVDGRGQPRPRRVAGCRLRLAAGPDRSAERAGQGRVEVSKVASATPAPGRPVPGRPRGLRASFRGPEVRWAYLFMLPWIVGLLVFQAGPMLASLVLSLTDYDIRNSPRFVGLDNYRQLLADPSVARSLANTAVYTVLHVPLSMAVALALALLLRRAGRAAGFFRTAFYLPVVTPAVAVGVLFLFLLNGQSGLINQGLALFGIDGPNWTTDSAWVKPGIVLMSLWSVGSTMVIYLAALNNVPRELYEAARIDGAGYLGLFWRIAVPLTMPALIVTFVFEFQASWTDLLKPLIYLRDGSLFTLPRGLKVILDQFGQGGAIPRWELVLAASVVATLPMIILFFVGQRYFVQGIATTGRKG